MLTISFSKKRWLGALPLTCFVTAYLIKLDQRIPSMDAVAQYIISIPSWPGY